MAGLQDFSSILSLPTLFSHQLGILGSEYACCQLGLIDIQQIELEEGEGDSNKDTEVKGPAIKASSETTIDFVALKGTFDTVSGFIKFGIMDNGFDSVNLWPADWQAWF